MIVKFSAALVCGLFWIDQLWFFQRSIQNIDSFQFLELFLLGALLFAVAFYLFIKYMPETLSRLEWASIFCMLIALITTSLMVRGIYHHPLVSVISVARNVRYVLYVLGGVSFYLTRHKMNFSFILWGLYIWLWQANLYNAAY